jgi:hypothetical protein
MISISCTCVCVCVYLHSTLFETHSYISIERKNRYALVLEFSPSPEYNTVKPICLPFLGLKSKEDREKENIEKEQEEKKEETNDIVQDVMNDVMDRVVAENQKLLKTTATNHVVSEILENVLTRVTDPQRQKNDFEEEVKELEDVLTSAENALNDSRELRNSISSLSPKNRSNSSTAFFNKEEEDKVEEEEEKTQLLVENEEDLIPTTEEPPPSTSNEIPVQFPSGYKIVLALKPLAPVPAAFSLHAVFTDAKGRCCEGRLRQISVGFQDLFLPLPAIPALRWKPKEFLSEQQQEELQENHTRLTQVLFDPLWKSIGEKQNIKDKTRRGSSGNADSVKLLLLTRDRVREYIQKCLAPYVVSFSNVKSQSNKDQEESWYAKRIVHAMNGSKVDLENEEMFQICRVAVFLPPSYHLLFSFHISAYSTVVRIRTDYWQVLSELDKYFNAWVVDHDGGIDDAT